MATLTNFTVAGRGLFPLDMLRYDRCWPRTGDDVANISDTTAQRKVSLVTEHPNITRERWASFGWPVIASQQRY